jgi:UDP-N-acetylglucosamine 2-epimerase (non-hydrolysing)
MKVMSIFGTRPEMIKMWSVLKKLDELSFDHVMVHTGQNFTPELKDFFFKDLELRTPDYDLNIDVSSYGKEVADVIAKTDELLLKEKPDALLILGDTYSGLSVMPAAHHGVKIFHMEAGLRAWDVRMPEQRNRMLIDHMSNILLPFHQYHRENLIRENIHPSRIFVTGNPTFEPMRAFLPQIKNSDILERLGVKDKKYFLVSAHRSENVDNPYYLQQIFDALKKIREEFEVDIIYPMHPRTKSKLKGIEISESIKIIDPLGFYDFNRLFMGCKCILSDSGTSPEESYFYKVPCVSLRKTTERPETVEGGAHIVSGLTTANIVESVDTAINQKWSGRYELEEGFEPSTIVINTIQSQITNFF